MVKTIVYLLLLGLTIFLGSCKQQSEITKRKYTQGQYREFNLHREKSGRTRTEDSVISDSRIPVLTEKKEELLTGLKEIGVASVSADPAEVLNEDYPWIAGKMDSVVERTMRKDSTWRTDSLPDVIETALAGQAMVGLGTVGGLATIAAPELIWFTIIPMIGIPFFLLISLIAAAIAFGKINRGELDARYKKWMRLWALCLLINLCLGSIVLLHFTSI